MELLKRMRIQNILVNFMIDSLIIKELQDLSKDIEEDVKGTDQYIRLGVGNFNRFLSERQLEKLDNFLKEAVDSNIKIDSNTWESEITIIYDALCNTPFMDDSLDKLVPIRYVDSRYLQLWDGRYWTGLGEGESINPLFDQEKLIYLDNDRILNACTYWGTFYTRLNQLESIIDVSRETVKDFFYVDQFTTKTLLFTYFVGVQVWLSIQNFENSGNISSRESYKRLVVKFPWFNESRNDLSTLAGLTKSIMPWGDPYLKSY